MGMVDSTSVVSTDVITRLALVGWLASNSEWIGLGVWLRHFVRGASAATNRTMGMLFRAFNTSVPFFAPGALMGYH